MTARHEESQALQRLIDSQYRVAKHVDKISFLVAAESYDLNDDMLEICRGIPSGSYARGRLCDQLNSAIVGHGWEQTYGTVE